MIENKVIKVLSRFLEVSTDELTMDTMLFLDYDFDDDDITKIVSIFNKEFDIEIDSDEFCEIDTIEQLVEYIADLI